MSNPCLFSGKKTCGLPGGLSVVTSDYKSSDFTEAMQDCTLEYYTGDLQVQYTGQIFPGESCGATVTRNFTW